MTDPMVPVLDGSKYQGAWDFKVAVSHRVRGVIIRLGNGKSLDPLAYRYMPDARDAGLAVGGYWFCNPKAHTHPADQMALFLARAEQLGKFDIPPMLDIENFVNEYPNPGSNMGWTGPKLQAWLEKAVDYINISIGVAPIAYSNASYFRGQGMVAGRMSQCPLIVARYPFYFQGAPKPPADATMWERWLYTATTARPEVPKGWGDYDGWQFAAGFDGMGPIYGATSPDVDLNLIKAASWASWLQQMGGGDTPPPVEVDPPVVVQPPRQTAPYPIPAVVVPLVDEEEEPMQAKILQSDSHGVALQLIFADGYTMTGLAGQSIASVQAGYSTGDPIRIDDGAYDDLASKAKPKA